MDVENSEKKIRSLFSSFSNLKVVIVGDIMLDKYLYGNSDRLSPEAPVPVIDITGSESKAGGAANVALNIKSLGATPYLFSVIGGDLAGEELLALINDQSIDTDQILHDSSRITTAKTRVMAKGKHVIRFDSEQTNDIDENMQEDLYHLLADFLMIEKIDIIILEDYNKGLFTESLIKCIIDLCNDKKIPVAVDPKKKNFFAYKNCFLFKPNLREIKDSLNIDVDTEDIVGLNNISDQLQSRLSNQFTLITLGDKGIFSRYKNQSVKKDAHHRTITDVSGAGDTVISVASLCIAAGADAELTTEISNIAGGLVCELSGVVPVDHQQLLDEVIKIVC
jgi:rfaE bifunctional protein kinase chain/domain